MKLWFAKFFSYYRYAFLRKFKESPEFKDATVAKKLAVAQELMSLGWIKKVDEYLYLLNEQCNNV